MNISETIDYLVDIGFEPSTDGTGRLEKKEGPLTFIATVGHCGISHYGLSITYHFYDGRSLTVPSSGYADYFNPPGFLGNNPSPERIDAVLNRYRAREQKLDEDTIKIRQALNSGDAELLTKYPEAKLRRIDLWYNRTFLYDATTAEIVKILVQAGLDVNHKDKYRKTPLHEASSPEVVEALISYGADINSTDNEGNTALHYPKSIRIVPLLLSKGIVKDVLNKNGMSALHNSVRWDNIPCTTLLLSAGTNPNQLTDKGENCLFFVRSDRMLYLLEDFNISADVKNNKGISPLFFVPAKMISSLVSYGCDLHSRDKSEATLLHHASTVSQAEYLIDKGLDVNALDNKQNTPLHSVASRSYSSTAVVQLLLKQGADINALNSDGDTALRLVRNKQVAKILTGVELSRKLQNS